MVWPDLRKNHQGNFFQKVFLLFLGEMFCNNFFKPFYYWAFFWRFRQFFSNYLVTLLSWSIFSPAIDDRSVVAAAQLVNLSVPWKKTAFSIIPSDSSKLYNQNSLIRVICWFHWNSDSFRNIIQFIILFTKSDSPNSMKRQLYKFRFIENWASLFWVRRWALYSSQIAWAFLE